MFERFSDTARKSILLARDVAWKNGDELIQPHHVLLAVMSTHPALICQLIGSEEQMPHLLRRLKATVEFKVTVLDVNKVALGEETKFVLRMATKAAKNEWSINRSPTDESAASDDLEYWRKRTGQLPNPRLPRLLHKLVFRRSWEVELRHILLGMLHDETSSITRLLAELGGPLQELRNRASSGCRQDS